MWYKRELQKGTAAPAGPRNGGKIGVGKPSAQRLYRARDGWIKPDAGPNWIKLSDAVTFDLGLSLGRTR